MVSVQTSCLIIVFCLLKEPSYQATSPTPEHDEMSIKHKNWMIQHKRYYLSKDETEKRFKIFKDNVEYIENFNRDKSHTYELGINEFADLTKEEFYSKYTTNSMPSYQRFSVSTFRYENVREVPCNLDWRELGAVTPVKSQGNCAISSENSHIWDATIHRGSSYEVAGYFQQWLLSKAFLGSDPVFWSLYQSSTDGCKGGSIEHAFEFVNRNKGLSSDKDYPYQRKEGTCKSGKPSSLAAKITGYEHVPPNNETAMLMAVANQPVSVQLDPSLFQFYKSGVLTGECGTKLAHAVTAVGYSTSEDGIKYWLLKNSWGSNWGEDGYIRLERDIDAVQGMCGLAMILTYPTI